MTVLYLRYIWLYSILVKLSGDVEEKSGLKPKPCQSFSICHWNVNSVSTHNFSKVSLLRAYISIHKFDVICISETFLNSDTAVNDDNLKIEGYNIVRSDHQNLAIESGVHPSLHPNCHHLITYNKFNLKIHYPPPYEREIWHYDQANVDHIRKAVNLFSWEKNIKKSRHKRYGFFV